MSPNIVQATARSDTVCGTCKTAIAKGDPCYKIYRSLEDKTLLGHRCTKRICINGERIDELPPGAAPARDGLEPESLVDTWTLAPDGDAN